mmetsp:Transcript_774/g.2755  ORF Transcript_774/g.2755 Transcript_774/m.2755 type:complete len:239 (+) Transcript_774:255-971(+)
MAAMGTPNCTSRRTSSAAPDFSTSFSSPLRLSPPRDDGSTDNSAPGACGSMSGGLCRPFPCPASVVSPPMPPMCPSPAPRPWIPPGMPDMPPPPARVFRGPPPMPSESELVCARRADSIMVAYSLRTSFLLAATSSSMPPAPTFAGLRYAPAGPLGLGLRLSPASASPSSSSLKSSSPRSSRSSLNLRDASISLSSRPPSDLALALARSLAWRWFLTALSVRPGRSFAMDAQRLPSFL